MPSHQPLTTERAQLVIDLLTSGLSEVDFAVTAADGKLVTNQVPEDYGEYNEFLGRVHAAIADGPSPPPDRPSWLARIDDLFSAPAPPFEDHPNREMVLSEYSELVYRRVCETALVAVSVEHIVTMRSFTDSILRAEHPFLQRACVPRDVAEFDRLYEAVLAMPSSYLEPAPSGGYNEVPQPLRAQLCFAMLLVGARSDVGPAVGQRRLALAQEAPEYLFGSPELGNKRERSQRPEYWLSHVTDPDIWAAVRFRGNPELTQKMDNRAAEQRLTQVRAAAMRERRPMPVGPLEIQWWEENEEQIDGDLLLLGESLRTRAPRAAARLRPGRNARALAVADNAVQAVGPPARGHHLPGEIGALWRWADGSEGGIVFGTGPFGSFDDSFEHYRALIGAASGVDPWPRILFPLTIEGPQGLFVELWDSYVSNTRHAVWAYEADRRLFQPMFGSLREMVDHYRRSLDAGTLKETIAGDLVPGSGWEASHLGDEHGDLDVIDRDDIESWPELWERTAAGLHHRPRRPQSGPST